MKDNCLQGMTKHEPGFVEEILIELKIKSLLNSENFSTKAEEKENNFIIE